MYVCPADTAAVPPEVVWQLLIEPATWGIWADAAVKSVDPPGRAQPGQVIKFGSGFAGIFFEASFVVDRVDDSTHDLELEGIFPFGLTMHEHITVRPVDGQSRIQFG